MKKKTNDLTIVYLLFIILLFVSGMVSGALYQLFYFLSFALPVALGLYFSRRDGVQWKEYLCIEKDKAKKAIPLIAPTISVIIFVSFITSLIIYHATGRVNIVNVGNSYPLALISHALLPAIFEEILFRYLPLRMLASYSRRGAVLISAFFFAFAHHDVFTIPYAFFAGAILMAIDIATDSLWPSVVIHFINNVVSVSMIFYVDDIYFAPVVYSVLGLLTVISLAYIVKNRKKYLAFASKAFEEGEEFGITAEMICFAALMLFVAFYNLF